MLVTSAFTNAGLLDLSANDLIVHGGNLTTLSGQIASGYNGGHWNGSTGITSSAAASDTALAIESDSNGMGGTFFTTFDGVAVGASDVLVKYTYLGDANLDGIVNGSDFTLIDNGFNSALTGWRNGDFNYDGVVNGDDYTLIDNAFNTQGASLAVAPAEMVASDTAQIADAARASVPEPTTLGLGIVVLAGIYNQRRRREPEKNVVDA